MIPKVIHYCWFGGNPLPDLAKKCIASWKKYFPNYEIKEWNESNFNIDICDYVREAYKEKKWAFVSDYARYWILYHEGGLYFDTDVEVIKNLDDIIEKGSFMGCESTNGSKEKVNCAPGLGLGVQPNLIFIKEILEFYDKIHFYQEDGSLNTTTIVKYTTDILKKYGWIPDGNLQIIKEIYIYPVDYFCPKNYETGELKITKNTRSIHHYTASWLTEEDHFKMKLGKKIYKYIPFISVKISSLIAAFISSVKFNGIKKSINKTISWIIIKLK